MRRVLRPPLVLAAWLEAIFNAFGPLRCSKTRKPLLPPKERNKAVKVVESIKAGYICDLEGNLLSPTVFFCFMTVMSWLALHFRVYGTMLFLLLAWSMGLWSILELLMCFTKLLRVTNRDCSRLHKTQRRARKDFQAGLKRLKGRLQKTPWQARLVVIF